MAYRPHGRAFADPTAPSAWAICDRCNFTYNHKELAWQYDFNAVGLYNKRLLVCAQCLDEPQAQFLNPILPPDPMPVRNARPFNFAAATIDYVSTQEPVPIVTQDDVYIVDDEASQNFSEV